MRIEEDLTFLEQYGPIIQLRNGDGGTVVVSPQYQGRVMTSAVEPGAESLGWINRPFIEAAKTGTPFDNYGGEDRFWLGPEGGQYSIFFSAGQPFVYGAWQVPPVLQEGAWDVLESRQSSALMGRKIEFPNYSDTRFVVDIRRRISLLGSSELQKQLGVQPAPTVKWLGFESDNTIVNAGGNAWQGHSGLLSIWILGMFMPMSDTRVIIPFETRGGGPVVNDHYFGIVPSERLAIAEAQGVVVFKCDGQYRSKIGVGSARAKAIAGSYSESARLLTIVHFDRDVNDARYVNSLWELQNEPYAGDVINSFNDGPVEPGLPSQGGFYEIETSSPAGELAPGAELRHRHRTFHFVGDREALNPVALATLGVSLDAIPTL